MGKETLSSKAYKEIKNLILSGKFTFGEQIDLKQLTEQLGYSSITPVREALILLANEELVEILPRKGMFISKMSIEDVLENFQLRELIELTVLKNTIFEIPDEVYNHYYKVFIEWRDNSSKVSTEEYITKDKEFHLALLAPCKNKTLLGIMSNIYDENARYRYSSLKNRDIHTAVNEHIRILSAIKNRDSTLAVEMLKEHLENSKKSLLNEKLFEI